MDFLKLLRSLEEFLYELCTWLLFFPRTLFRVIVAPRRMAAYVARELGQPEPLRFDDGISPPMFLMLALLLAHGVEIVLQQTVTGTNSVSRLILGNEEALLLYRSVTFAIWPLVASIHLTRRLGRPLTRDSLRRPFFEQCYLTAPFAITLSTAFVFVRLDHGESSRVAALVVPLACLWYLVVQARWLHAALGRSWPNALLSTLWVLALGTVINLLIGVVLLWPGSPGS